MNDSNNLVKQATGYQYQHSKTTEKTLVYAVKSCRD